MADITPIKNNENVHDFAYSGDLEALNTYLNAGGAVNLTDEDGRSPLHYASMFNINNCVEFLIKAGANIDLQDKWGNTPLHIAASNRDGDIAIKLLLQAGANRNIKDIEGELPIERAKNYNFPDNINAFIK